MEDKDKFGFENPDDDDTEDTYSEY